MIELASPIVITEHAIDRWCERVANNDRDAIRAEIEGHEGAIRTAMAFNARVVRLPNGAGLVRVHNRIVTVLAKHQHDRHPFGVGLDDEPVVEGRART